MNFDKAMTLPFLDQNPGNAVAYIKLTQDTKTFTHWDHNDWIKSRQNYYSTVKNPGPAWLHDIYKNRCRFNIGSTALFIDNLRLQEKE